MKRILLAGTTLLAFTALGSGAGAVPFDFTYTGSLVTEVDPIVRQPEPLFKV